jgi:DNA-binding SARP family transcriptional activator/Tfp pilus assembly protein PilF
LTDGSAGFLLVFLRSLPAIRFDASGWKDQSVSGEQDVELQLLGPVRLIRDGSAVTVGTRKQRFVLAVLALHTNQLVTVDRLIDLLWPERPPATARGIIHGHVSGLRAVLTTSGALAEGMALRREGPGYLLACDPMSIDAHRFTRLTTEAQAQADPGQQLAILDQALDLWRGPALADTAPEPTRGTLSRHLDEARLTVTERRLAVLLDLGRYDEAIPDLTRLADEHSERYRFTELLMTALHRTGRTAEALRIYRDTKQRLADEQGLDPPPRLRQLELAILRDEPGPAKAPTGATPTPAQLPADVYGFAGRADAIARLNTLLGNTDQPTAVVISAMSGTAGVGKTALAVHWAHRVVDRFPDGQLYTNLRGFDPGGTAATPGEAVRSLLDALDVSAQRVPAGLEAQTALYRSLLAGRRMLVLLDNARDADQVRPLLPGAPGCLVLVTSRNQLTGLVAGAGAFPLPLDLLDPDEARDLLARRLGVDRVAAEPAAVQEITERCARLPLALAVAAARAAIHPERSLAALAAELGHPHDRLDALATGDAGTDVRSVFSWSYRQLSGPAARLFRLLGVHPGPELSVSAAASLAGIPTVGVRPLLAELVRAHLIAERVPGRYALHDLLRAYAGELAASDEPEADRQTAVRRVLDHYLRCAHRADAVLNPTRDGIEPIPPLPGITVDEFEAEAAATDWLTAEYQVLPAAVRLAVDAGLERHAWQLVWSMAPFIDNRDFRYSVALHQTALRAARRLDDRAAQGHSHRRLGRAYAMLGEHDEAQAHLEHALEMCRQLGDETNQAHVHLALGKMLDQQGRYRDALHHGKQALAGYQASGHRVGQANSLNALGWLRARLGDYETALGYCRQALGLHQEMGHRLGEAETWDSIGVAYHHLARYADAVAAYRQALVLYRDHGYRYAEADTLVRVGETHHAAGDTDAARDHWRQALAILTDLDHPDAEHVQARLNETPPTPEGLDLSA